MQDQFLDVIDREEAERRFHEVLRLEPLGDETVSLEAALGRVLSADVHAPIDVPSFDRSNFDGFAVCAEDTFGAREEQPRQVNLLDEVISTGEVPSSEVRLGNALSIATGGMLPRGADAIVMVEHADVREGRLYVHKAVAAGFGVAYAGTDIAAGETVLRQGELLTSRETGVLAAIGVASITVRRRPRVAVISTGNEIIAPGQPMRPGKIYDSNARILSDAVRELGGEPCPLGIVADDLTSLRAVVHEAVDGHDLVLLSGGTSKGAGDVSYRVIGELHDPGIVAHGVALKPGKPICLAASKGKPVVILPGFPTSAIFTFHEFVAPVLRMLSGIPRQVQGTVPAELAIKLNSEIGRTEYVLVGLVEATASTEESERGTAVAFPMGKSSGSVTSFSRADGFVTVGRHHEIVEAGSRVDVQLLGQGIRPADLIVIGSHCVGLDYLLSRLQAAGIRTKFLLVGSTAGLEAARMEQCDVAGIHLLDPESGTYNAPFLGDDQALVPGYGRLQGIVFRKNDSRFAGQDAEQVVEKLVAETNCLMVNRNQGSGTRILIDRLLQGRQPAGYPVQSKSHNAVAAAVSQGRADWGVAIETVAGQMDLGFLPLQEEQFDFVVPRSRQDRPAVRSFCQILQDPQTRNWLAERGFRV